MENVFIFPKLKQTNNNLNNLTKEEIENITEHYIEQILTNTMRQGLNFNPNVYKDFELVFQSLKSALLRANDMYHPLQNYVDEFELIKNSKDFNKLKEEINIIEE